MERHGGNEKVVLALDGPVTSVALCDLMENGRDELEVRDGSVELDVSPYEIKTVRVS